MTTITQADRDAAARILRSFGAAEWHALRVQTGAWDDHHIVQAFARHRLAAEARAREEGAKPFAWADALAWHEPAHRAVMASVKLGAWMSAALDDPAVCDAMKADIREWFSAGEPMEILGQALTQAREEGAKVMQAYVLSLFPEIDEFYDAIAALDPAQIAGGVENE